MSGRKVKGVQHADLVWTGVGTAKLVIYRDEAALQLSAEDDANDGSHTDKIDVKGSGSYSYRVCETGANPACSSAETVVF